MKRITETAMKAKLRKELKAKGWASECMETRYGNALDLKNAFGRRVVEIETKIVDVAPPWTFRESGLRINQKKMLMNWPGETYLVAYQWTDDVYWVVKGSPSLSYWVCVASIPDVVSAIESGLAGVKELDLCPGEKGPVLV